MKYLGLDIGTRRTGVAFADSEDDILFSLPTIEHQSEDELFDAVTILFHERGIDELVLGLPLLPSGEEGKQANIAKSLSKRLQNANIPHSLLDERYTSSKNKNFDSDAAAACEILSVKLSNNTNI